MFTWLGTGVTVRDEHSMNGPWCISSDIDDLKRYNTYVMNKIGRTEHSSKQKL